MNDREKAVALKYDEVSKMPQVLCSGLGEIARQIVRLAEQHDIPLHEDPELTELLAKIPPGAQVSKECLEAVAAVLCFLYAVEKEAA